LPEATTENEHTFTGRVKAAWNALNGRFTQLDPDGFPVYVGRTGTGISISGDRAMYAGVVHSCVTLLSSVIATIPLLVYKRTGKGGVEEAFADPLYKLLAGKPNNWMTPFDYWQWNLECILLRGGFISWKNRLASGRVAQLIPLHPDTITRELSSTGRLQFSGHAMFGPNRYMAFDKADQDEFFWCNYRTLDGVTPVSPIRYCAEAIGLALTAEQHGARVLANDATPPLVITVPNKLADESLKNMAKMWKAAGSGSNYGMPRFLDNGAKVDRLSMSNEDAQYFETRRFQKEEICGIFRVPPSMIGDTQRAQGWSTMEQKNSDFLTYTLTPYLEAIEQAVGRSLVADPDLGRVYADYDTDALMKADTTSRTTYYNGMYAVGALNPNEIRARESLPPRDGGDQYAVKPAAVSTASPAKQKEETDNE